MCPLCLWLWIFTIHFYLMYYMCPLCINRDNNSNKDKLSLAGISLNNLFLWTAQHSSSRHVTGFLYAYYTRSVLETVHQNEYTILLRLCWNWQLCKLYIYGFIPIFYSGAGVHYVSHSLTPQPVPSKVLGRGGVRRRRDRVAAAWELLSDIIPTYISQGK